MNEKQDESTKKSRTGVELVGNLFYVSNHEPQQNLINAKTQKGWTLNNKYILMTQEMSISTPPELSEGTKRSWVLDWCPLRF